MTNSVSGTNVVKTANALGQQMNSSEDLMMDAFALKENDTAGAKKLAEKMGGYTKAEIDKMTPASLRIIAQKQYQDSSAMMNLLSSLIEKMGQIKDRIIQNIGR